MFNSKINIIGDKLLIMALYLALDPEQGFKRRGGFEIKKNGNKLTVNVKADDATAFRAIMTSLTGLIALVDKNFKICNGRKKSE